MSKEKQNWYTNPRKYHFIYKTTCKVNGKFYYGMHSTDDLNDGYIGSGTHLWHAIKKYGRENFSIEILEFLPDRESLKKREAELITEDLLKDPMCMNLTLGGHGGFYAALQKILETRCNLNSPKFLEYKASGRLRKNALRAAKLQTPEGCSKKSRKVWVDHREKMKEASLAGIKKMASAEVIEKRKRKFEEIGHQQGEKNSSFGTVWIKHESHGSKKIKQHELESHLDQGWSRGRISRSTMG